MKFFTSLFAAAVLTAAPAQAVPRYHSIVNPDGSAFTCKFTSYSISGTTQCYNVSPESRLQTVKSLTAGYALLNSCADKAMAQGISGGDSAWWDTCMGRTTN
jgi:hypothetical protein